jgi:hypothetical protein
MIQRKKGRSALLRKYASLLHWLNPRNPSVNKLKRTNKFLLILLPSRITLACGSGLRVISAVAKSRIILLFYTYYEAMTTQVMYAFIGHRLKTFQAIQSISKDEKKRIMLSIENNTVMMVRYACMIVIILLLICLGWLSWTKFFSPSSLQ